MAMHLAKRRRMEWEGLDTPSDSGSSISAAAAKPFHSTRFSPARYLHSHGWAGDGVPLDGHSGKGLKKPLTIPPKRDNKGLGQNRDRAVEWWDCLFEASAKALASKQPSEASSLVPSGAATPTSSGGHKLSLQGLAKKEQARRQLMSKFLRGQTIQMGPTHEELEATKKAEEAKSRSSQSSTDSSESSNSKANKSDKKERKAAKSEKKAAKASKKTDKGRKRLDKAAKTARRIEKEAKRAAKGKKRERKETRRAANGGQIESSTQDDSSNSRKGDKDKKSSKKSKKATEAAKGKQ